MEIGHLIDAIEESMETKAALTEELGKVSIELSKAKYEYSIAYSKKLVEKEKSTRLPMQLVQGLTAKEKYKVDTLEDKKMHLFNRLENTRQDINTLLTLLKTESELIK